MRPESAKSDATVTRVGLASYLNENTILRAAGRQGGSGAGSGEQRDVKTELDLEIRFELGKIGLDFAIERALKARGLVDRATDPGDAGARGGAHRPGFGRDRDRRSGIGRRDRSNLGIRYDFDDAERGAAVRDLDEGG